MVEANQLRPIKVASLRMGLFAASLFAGLRALRSSVVHGKILFFFISQFGEMTRKPSKRRNGEHPQGNPLFGKRDYPLISTVDALIALSETVKSYPFRFLLWTEDRKGFQQYHEGRSVAEVEVGYSTKEHLFFAECTSRGDRWWYDIVSEHSSLWDYLRKQQYQALVLCGEDLVTLASRAIYYFDRVPLGPKTVILAFQNRLIEHSHLHRLWSFLKGQNRLHLLKNLAYLNSSRTPKFLPVIYDKPSFDPTQPIWNVAIEQITKDHIHNLFGRGIEEGENIDYKQSGCLSSKADIAELLKDFAAMANATGGIIIVGIRETDGRPSYPIKPALQSIPNVDRQINRLHQLISTHFGEVAPKVEIRSLEVLTKRLLLIKVFQSVEPVGTKKKPSGDVQFPMRSGRITVWRSSKTKSVEQA
jgi:Putative DNA-binding domain